jgi:hypothetical protein
MAGINALLARLIAAEDALMATEIIAPTVPGGRIQTRIDGLIRQFRVEPREFEGWGRFRPRDARHAALVGAASAHRVEAWLRLLPVRRLRLVAPLRGRTWLACDDRPATVHLVEEGRPFDPIVARDRCWFERIDRREDPRIAERLREAAAERLALERLRFPGLTPEMRAAYEIACPAPDHRARLQDALAIGGGVLDDYHDHGELWTVEWTGRDGQRHSSAISPGDLTVLSAGICLSGRDGDFDLQSLVGVCAGQ